VIHARENKKIKMRSLSLSWNAKCSL